LDPPDAMIINARIRGIRYPHGLTQYKRDGEKNAEDFILVSISCFLYRFSASVLAGLWHYIRWIVVVDPWAGFQAGDHHRVNFDRIGIYDTHLPVLVSSIQKTVHR
jgi:hypothetical protein